MAKAQHLLSQAGVVWREMQEELQDKGSESSDSYADSAQVPPEEIRKVAKWYQQAVTKFGASAAVAEGPQDPALRPVAEEVIKAFTAAVGTLLALRRGAGPSLRQELRDAGSALAEATEQLGAAVGTASMAMCAGKVLDRCKLLERVSAHNRAATRRRVLASLAQLRDANRELAEALRKDAAVGSASHRSRSVHSRGGRSSHQSDEEDDDDLLDGPDLQELEPHERRVVETLVPVVTCLEEALKQVSQACMPPAGDEGPAMTIAQLEAAVAQATGVASAVDGLAAHSLGGLDVADFAAALRELATPAASLAALPLPGSSVGDDLRGAMARLQAAFDEAAKHEA